MNKIFQLITSADMRKIYDTTPIAAAPMPAQPPFLPPQTTIVGDLVQKMDRTYRSYTERADRLTASIADQQEQLRQTRVTIAAIEAAMTSLADEVVLTSDERQAAKAAADARFDAVLVEAFQHDHEGPNDGH